MILFPSTIKDKIQTVLRLDLAIKLVWHASPLLALTNVSLLLIQGFLPVLSLYVTKLIIDDISGMFTASGSYGIDSNSVYFYIGLYGCITLFEIGVQSLGRYVNEAQAMTVTDSIHELIHAHSVAVDLEYYENAQYFDSLHRAQREAVFRPTKIVNSLATMLRNLISLAAIALLLLSCHWSLVILLLTAGMPLLLVKIRFSGSIYQWLKQHTKTERQAWYYNWLLTSDTHAKEIRLFNLGNLFISRYKTLRTLLRSQKLALTSKKISWEFIAQILSVIAIIGAYLIVIHRSTLGVITLGDLVMYLQAFQRGQSTAKELLAIFATLYEDNLFLSNLSDFLDLKPKIAEPVTPKQIPSPVSAQVCLDRVTFHYPGGNRQALQNISMTVEPGEHIALVGENGSGKTTLVKLLCRLYDPDEGTITLNGANYKEYAVDDLRSIISVIFQDFSKYNVTAGDNIWFGDVSTPLERGRIAEAAGHSGAHDVIEQLSKRYETILGKMFESGEEISIGQWQKVALARAFLRPCSLLILDEPTSSLDAKMEYEIFKKFHELTKGKTAVFISHRLSNVKMADRIYVLHHGQIAESGTHDQLLRAKGIYCDLFNRQAKHYQ